VVGSALSALSGVAERTGSAILGLTHPPKGTSDPLTVAIGSTAWTAVARIVWLLGRDPDDEGRGVVRVSKSNFKEPAHGVSFSIAEDERYEVGYICGLAESDVTAEDLAAASVPSDERSERQEARELLRALLAEGPVQSAEVMKTTTAAGLSERTVKRARGDLGVVASRSYDPETGRVTGWTLALSAMAPTSGPAPVPGPLGTLGTLGLTSGDEHSSTAHRAHNAHSAEEEVSDTLANEAPCRACHSPTPRCDDQGQPLCWSCEDHEREEVTR
jgi:hypothetical protein